MGVGPGIGMPALDAFPGAHGVFLSLPRLSPRTIVVGQLPGGNVSTGQSTDRRGKPSPFGSTVHRWYQNPFRISIALPSIAPTDEGHF
jgi:hypothetical protein